MPAGPRATPFPVVVQFSDPTNPITPTKLLESSSLFVNSLSAVTISATNYQNLPAIGGATSVFQLDGTGVFVLTSTNTSLSSLVSNIELSTVALSAYIAANEANWAATGGGSPGDLAAYVLTSVNFSLSSLVNSHIIDGTIHFTSGSLSSSYALSSWVNDNFIDTTEIIQYATTGSLLLYALTASLSNYLLTSINVTSLAGTSTFETTGYARVNYATTGQLASYVLTSTNFVLSSLVSSIETSTIALSSYIAANESAWLTGGAVTVPSESSAVVFVGNPGTSLSANAAIRINNSASTLQIFSDAASETGGIDLFPNSNTEGLIRWDPDYHTLGIQGDDDTRIILGIDEIIPVRNNTGATIHKGQVAYVSGAAAGVFRGTIGLLDDTVLDPFTIGVCLKDIANGADGYLIKHGLIKNATISNVVKTGVNLTQGDLLYISDTLGKVTNTPPGPGKHTATIGIFLTSGSNQISYGVAVKEGYDLQDLHDVGANATQSGDTIAWDASLGYYVTSSLNSYVLTSVNTALSSTVTGHIADGTIHFTSGSLSSAYALSSWVSDNFIDNTEVTAYATTASVQQYETTAYARNNYLLTSVNVTSLTGTSTFETTGYARTNYATTGQIQSYVLTSTNLNLSSLVSNIQASTVGISSIVSSHLTSAVHWNLETLNQNYINASGDSSNNGFYFSSLSATTVSATNYINLPSGSEIWNANKIGSILIGATVQNPEYYHVIYYDPDEDKWETKRVKTLLGLGSDFGLTDLTDFNSSSVTPSAVSATYQYGSPIVWQYGFNAALDAQVTATNGWWGGLQLSSWIGDALLPELDNFYITNKTGYYPSANLSVVSLSATTVSATTYLNLTGTWDLSTLNSYYVNVSGDSANAGFHFSSVSANGMVLSATAAAAIPLQVRFASGSTASHAVFASADGTEIARLNLRGTNNLFFGKSSGNSWSTGSNNVAIGHQASQFLSTGSDTVAIGSNANYNSTTSQRNTSVGSNAGAYPGTSTDNVNIGYYAGYTQNGSFNVSIGPSVNYGNVGSRNVGLGYQALNRNTSGTANIGLGYRAGFGFSSTASNNIAIGQDVNIAEPTTFSNTIVIGSGTNSTASNQTIIGHPQTSSTIIRGAVSAASYVNAPTTSGTFSTGDVLYYNGTVWVKLSRPTLPAVLLIDNFTPTEGGFPYWLEAPNSTPGQSYVLQVDTDGFNIPGAISWVSKN